MIKLGKDELNNLDHLNAVYKIACNNCPVSYIGQTGCSTGRHMYEHNKSVVYFDEKSVIALHCSDINHYFDFNKPQILDNELSTFKRTFSEMLHMHST